MNRTTGGAAFTSLTGETSDAYGNAHRRAPAPETRRFLIRPCRFQASQGRCQLHRCVSAHRSWHARAFSRSASAPASHDGCNHGNVQRWIHCRHQPKTVIAGQQQRPR
ncbi:hypothetical protein [Azospirillum argentinense]